MYETYKSYVVLMVLLQIDLNGQVRARYGGTKSKLYLNFRSSSGKYNLYGRFDTTQRRAKTEVLGPVWTCKYDLPTCVMWSQRFDWDALDDFFQGVCTPQLKVRTQDFSNSHHDTRSINLKPDMF